MIDSKLRDLGEYIEKIDTIEPIELIDTYMKHVEKDLKDITREQLEIRDKFSNDLVELVREYSRKGIHSIIINELINVLFSFCRKSIIESRADLLGIDRKMYKSEMNLLFKGK